MSAERFYLWSDTYNEPLTNVIGELITWPDEISASQVAAHYSSVRLRPVETTQRGVDCPDELSEGRWPLAHREDPA